MANREIIADVESNEKTVDTHNLPGQRSVSPVDLAEKRTSVSAAQAAKKILDHSNDADEAMKAFASGEAIEIDEATNKRLLRIIDWHLVCRSP